MQERHRVMQVILRTKTYLQKEDVTRHYYVILIVANAFKSYHLHKLFSEARNINYILTYKTKYMQMKM